MKYVLTLIGNSQTPLGKDHVETAAATLPGTPTPDWLKEAHACDLPFDAEDMGHAEAAVRKALAGAAVDIVAQPAEGRRKKLLVADMDSTIIQQECIDELAAELGLKDRIAEITERAMRGEIDFEPALRERVSLILEGVHIHPSMVERIPQDGDAVIAPIMLALLKRSDLKERIRKLEAIASGVDL